MLSLILGSIPREVFDEAKEKLDRFCREAAQRQWATDHRAYRLLWRRRGNAIVLSEEFSTPAGKTVRYDSAKFEYEGGLWRLFHLDVAQRWRRYLIAPATADFALAFSHWQRNETGIFSRAEPPESGKAATRLRDKSVLIPDRKHALPVANR